MIRNAEPFIGITCDVQLPKSDPKTFELICDHRYPEAIKRAGGYPILLPISTNPTVIQKYLERVDAVVVVGGDDVDPRLYGEKPLPDLTKIVFGLRLEFEKELYKQARKRKLPILGICYGMQLINVLEGGTLFQDILTNLQGAQSHNDRQDPMRKIRLTRSSFIYSLIAKTQIRVHCEHHQAIARLAPIFSVGATSADGLIEAIESVEDRILAVQWHPERTPRTLASQKLFEGFIQLAKFDIALARTGSRRVRK